MGTVSRGRFAKSALQPPRRNVVLDGVIVANLIKGIARTHDGAHRDPIFGPVLLVGDGGETWKPCQTLP
jgi:acyl-CoA synthetase (NDP forming)